MPQASFCKRNFTKTLLCLKNKMGNRRAGYGNRTRLPGLGSPCTTDVLIPHKKKGEINVSPLEPIPGLEPGTHALRMRCSTN